MSQRRPLCYHCKHFTKNQTCRAFPNEIPDAIFFEGADHRVPWPGDDDIMFEIKPGHEDEAADILESVPVGYRSKPAQEGEVAYQQ